MKKLSIVFQTHWDREWYLNVDTYNFRLKKVISRILDLLDNNEIESFVFDGQVKALEDYLSVCSDEDNLRVLDYLQKNKIIIGPWYVLSDEFLVSGESLIRNLEIGIKKANKYSTHQKVGYLPDTFGHISQMPQILSQFGLQSSVLWRGVVPNDLFFNWAAPDGTSVFVVYLKEGYYQPIVDQNNYKELIDAFLSKMMTFSSYNNILLTNGGDHLMPANGSISEHLKEIKQTHQIDVNTTTYEQYIKSIEDKQSYETIKGELRSNKGIYVLPNVLSTRYNLKQQNQKIEEKIKLLEALTAKNNIFNQYQHQVQLEQIWETILLNHPHDSICGCSLDEVHTEMETRSMKINKQLDAMITDTFIDMKAYRETTNDNAQDQTKLFDDYTHFSVYNPTVRRINGFIKVRIFVNGENPLLDEFVVTDGSIDYSTIIVSKTKGRIFESPLDSAPQFRTGYYYEIVFRAKSLQGLSFNKYSLKKGTPIQLEQTKDAAIENNILTLKASSTGVTVTNKKTNKTFNKMHQFVSSLDAGDEYNYSRPETDVESIAKLESTTSLKSEFFQQLILTYSLELPKGLVDNFTKPSKETVINTIKTTITLYHDNPEVFFHTTYDNHASNQRTRLQFDLGTTIKEHYSDTAFDLVQRTVREESFVAPKQKEVPVVVDPSYSTIAINKEVTFNHFGLQEYQIVPTQDNSRLEVTMLRSVGQISRDDLRSRGGGAGPSFDTPDAQMIGQYEYEYSLHFTSELYDNNDRFRNPTIITKGHVEDIGSLLELQNEAIHVSSIRKNNDVIEVRLYNPSTEIQQINMTSSYPINKIEAVDLQGNKTLKNTKSLQAKEIKTLHIDFKEQNHKSCDVLVCGGSIGGVRAAVKLLEEGHKVILTEATKWIGGQLTNQAVPLDEHPFIEEFGCPASYRAFRTSARDYYRNQYNLKDHIKNKEQLNPGNAWVTRLAFEPKVAHQLFIDSLKPYIGNQLELLTEIIPYASESTKEEVQSITVENIQTKEKIKIDAKFYIDATDTGDVLPITNTEYVTGSEGKENTNELHASITKNSSDMQPVTHVVAMRWNEDQPTSIKKPELYDYFKKYKTPYSDKNVLSEYGPDSSTQKERKFNTKYGRMPLWSYRRFFDPSLFEDSKKMEMTTINWPQNDYFMGNIFDDEFDDIHRYRAKELTKSFVYYLQNEVPRDDGGFGYKEMEIATDELGTEDGFAMAPYIRESRRIKAIKTVVEEDVSGLANKTVPTVTDSVGVGSYHIDLHITTKSHRFFYDNTWPFEIPLGTLIPINKQNLLPACKNIGTTHLTNGCFRLHPVEWTIGEVSGLFAAYLLKQNITPQECYKNKEKIKEFQEILIKQNIELHWPKDKIHII